MLGQRHKARQTETHNHFSTNSQTQQPFQSNRGLLSPKYCRMLVESQTNIFHRIPLKFKAIKYDPVLLPQDHLELAQATNLPTQTCHTPQRLSAVTWDLNWEQLFLTVYCYLCCYVWLNRWLTSMPRTENCRHHKSHYTAHKKVIERNVLNCFCQNPKVEF